MKIVILGDIHGRMCWCDIINKEKPDKVIFMDNGYIVVEGTPEEVFDSQNHRMQEFLGKLSD